LGAIYYSSVAFWTARFNWIGSAVLTISDKS
jgi:hypothetical protein